MEISLEAIISLIGLCIGGGSIGGFLFWKQTKKKAIAEAKLAEAEAKLKETEVIKAQIEAKKEDQDYYQQLAKDLAEDREDRKRQNDELRAERDHYKNERNEYRDHIDKLTRSTIEWKRLTDDTLDDLRRQVARNGRQIEAMRPFMCADLSCKLRQRVTISDEGIVKKPRGKKPAQPLEQTSVPAGLTKADIEPYNED